MSRIKSLNEVEIYEVDDEEVSIGKHESLNVASHWNRNCLIILEVGKKKYAVVASDLQKAISNATNA